MKKLGFSFKITESAKISRSGGSSDEKTIFIVSAELSVCAIILREMNGRS